MSVGLQGLEAMQKTLEATKDKIVKRAAKAGINAGLVPLAQAMRSAINASDAPPAVKREARKTVGKRFDKKYGPLIGKAGFGVAKTMKSIKKKTEKRAAKGGQRGVGLSASNIHWFVLGTEDRYTGTRSWKLKHGRRRERATGNKRRYTGRIPELLKGVTTMAVGTAGPAMVEAARQRIELVLAREVAKQAKKGAIK